MSSEGPKLPFIDFSNQELKPGFPLWNSLKIQVREALEEYGCFEASYDRIPIQLRKSIFDAVTELFDLPLQVKVKNSNGKPYHGYIGQSPLFPLYEGMGIDEANVLEHAESFSKDMWPEGNSEFSKTIQNYAEQLSELDQMVRKMVLESLGVEQYIDEHLESTHYLLRVIKYKGPQTNETKLGLPSHRDANLVTILHQNQVQGLELQKKDGQWIDFKPSPNSFVVMIGESFHAWTNGRLHPPNHRVMMTGNEARYSVGLFSFPKDGYMVKAPRELVDETHPLLFQPFNCPEYLAYIYKGGKKVYSSFKTYCGA
ncbi:probable 2-oxoglutarate-dependent dioxygenase AOP1 [Coffea eugenioides]|uniref:probable 2-oxoglutarate-dependent dioxygenase AOP1 n=1 Tax=Coffea eugenioides TaxID=49369 RepID=UPI000F60599C|nr:probable 2-oxoglutarate-dependent dioxygenase AOP1 [Coffea eugenioides]